MEARALNNLLLLYRVFFSSLYKFTLNVMMFLLIFNILTSINKFFGFFKQM